MKFQDLKFEPHSGYLGGVHAVVNFPNGYGASVVRTPYTYGGSEGLYGLAVMKDGGLCYDSGITDDVIGWQTEDDISGLLEQIEALSAEAV